MKTMFFTSLYFVFPIFAIAGVDQISMVPKASTKWDASSENSFANRLLVSAKTANTKLQAKQECSTELKVIAEAMKTIEAARLRAVIGFTQQQATLTDKTAMEAQEARRKAVSEQFNELLRLIDQVEKNRQTALLSEKLDALVVFLEPAASDSARKEAVAAPSKPLSRGAAPVKEKAAIPMPERNGPLSAPVK